MRTNDYYKASIGNPGTVWMSSWGEGVVEIAGDTIRRRISTTGQPKFAGTVAGNPNYAVIGSAAVDPQGFTWFANLTAITGNYVVRLANDTTFNYFKNEVSPQMGFFYSMVVDHNGTKWFTNSETIKERYPYGLFYFNEKSLVSGTSTTNGWGVMTSADNLPDDVIFALAVDNDNNICVGTPSGMLIINDPIYPKSRNFRPYVVRTRVIQTIAVDALNNKWLGTKEGVFVINPDGTQLLEQFTVASTNGKLASNDVKTIAIDQKHGVVYFGTDYGISSYGIVATQVSRSAGTIAVGPNPFVIPSNTHLMIRNLVANSSVKIFSVDGTLITEFLAQGGGRAFWDGKDKSNKYVSSGIYFVIVFAENGEQIGTGKIAIIKK
jgi:ligand-binding sensor domain-containing protein